MEEGSEEEPRLYVLKRPDGCDDPLPSVLHPITATTEEVQLTTLIIFLQIAAD